MLNLNFDPFPILNTERLQLRRLMPEDAPDIFKIRSDKLVAEYLNRYLQHDVSEAESFIETINDGIDNNSWIMWAIAEKDNPRLMGTICLWQIDEIMATADIGYEMMPEFQRKGYIKEAIEPIIDYAFDNLQLKAIEAESSPENVPSLALLEYFGFEEIENTREDKSLVIYSLKRPAT